jgi:virginiamycin B lyase
MYEMGFGRVVAAILLVLSVACSGDDSTSPKPEPEPQESVVESPSPEIVPIDPAVVSDLAAFEKEAAATIELDGFPDFMTVAAGHVWVGNGSTEAVDRIEIATDKVADPTRGPASCTGFDSGFGSVWVPSCKDGTVYRIDQKTGKVTAKIKVEEVLEETSVGIGDDGVWLITGDGLLSRIDPETDKVAETLQVEPDSAGVAVGFGSVWVSSNRNNIVQRIDPDKGRAVATVEVGEGPRFLTIGEEAVWVINQLSGTVSRIDPNRDAVTAEIDVGDPFAGGDIAAGNGFVWTATANGPLSVIEQASDTVVRQWEMHGADALALDGTTAWISDHDVQKVYRFTLER